MTMSTEERPQPVKIREKISRSVVGPLMGQFKSVAEAIFELVDNAFDEFDGCRGGSSLSINIEIGKRKIVVENEGGKGMGPVELDGWLNWGQSGKKDAIGEWGQGGKSAMGYLGNKWIIKSKRWDDSWVWQISEDNWSDASSEEHEYDATPIEKMERQIGYCKFEISELRLRRQNVEKLREQLANTYRELLSDGKATIKVNGEPTLPVSLPLYEGHKIDEFKFDTSNCGRIKGWVGRLKRDARSSRGPSIKGGMRLLRQGRLIYEGEFFGHPGPSYKQSLNTLIGEVDLGSRVPVLPNKTDFDRDSSGWAEIQKQMQGILKPHIDNLLKIKEDEKVTNEDRKKLSAARDTMIDALQWLNKLEQLKDKFGRDRGRKSPQRQPHPDVEPAKTAEQENGHGQGRPHQPRTPPPGDAVGRLRRLGVMPPWEVRILDPEVRSTWEEKGSTRTLVINKAYPLYEEWQGDELYLMETAAFELAKPMKGDTITLEEYLEEVSRIMRACCAVMHH